MNQFMCHKLKEGRINKRLHNITKSFIRCYLQRKQQTKILIAHTPTTNQTNGQGSCVPYFNFKLYKIC